ncbi:cation channel sperm-associated protein 1 isoform X2 [Oryctolagus cuniculus]|uniref:cation channel sperm-associated protein 1 isoform X2 n=1 Tax=Oryctolagus cuniculus TaxID=9986 RepID=UPI003879E068
MSEKGQNEADPDGGGVFTRPHSSPPQHRPGHGGALRHHESHHHWGASQHRGLARPHGGPRHPREFQDNQDDRAFSHHAPREAHHPTSLGLSPSRSIAPSHHSYSEDSSDDDQYHGNRVHHHHAESSPHGGRQHLTVPPPYSGPHHHAEPDPHGGPHLLTVPPHHGGPHHHTEPGHHGGPHHHTEPGHHGGPHHHAVSDHHGGPHHHAEPDPHGGPQHLTVPSHHGGPHRHTEPPHHGGPHRHAEPPHHGGSHRHAEPDPHGGPHRHAEPDPHGGPHRHTEPSHHGGPHHHAEPPHHGGPHRHVEDGHRGGLPHHGEPSYREEFHHKHARPHHHDSSPHRRHPRYGDNVSRTSLDGSSHHGTPHHREHHAPEHPHGEWPHHRSKHQRPRQPDDHPHSDPRHRDYLWSPSDQSVPGTSQGSSSLSHPATPHAHVHRWSSGHSTAPSHVAGSSKVEFSQESTSKDSESYTEDNEQLRKRKTRRTPRSRKKLQLENCFQWWYEKLIVLFHGLQRMLWKLTHCLAFETFIFLVVCLNTIMLVAQTFAEVEIRGEWHFLILDCIFLCIYMVEALLKIIALGFSYFHDFWNNLDFCIMMVAVLDFTLMQLNPLSYSFYHQSLFRILKVFKSMRALRAIRVLRRLSFLTSLHEVTGTLARSLPSITAILVLMFTCLFLFSVVLRALFRKSDPKRFQNIFSTLFTLFTMLTLDDWSLIYMDNRAQGAWYIIPILMVYIIIQYFIFLNLVIAVLVDNFQMALLKGLEKVRQERAARIQENLLDDSLTELRQAEPKEIRSEGTMQKQLLEKKFGTLTENSCSWWPAWSSSSRSSAPRRPSSMRSWTPPSRPEKRTSGSEPAGGHDTWTSASPSCPARGRRDGSQICWHDCPGPAGPGRASQQSQQGFSPSGCACPHWPGRGRVTQAEGQAQGRLRWEARYARNLPGGQEPRNRLAQRRIVRVLGPRHGGAQSPGTRACQDPRSSVRCCSPGISRTQRSEVMVSPCPAWA